MADTTEARYDTMSKPADYKHQAPWKGITFAELKDKYPSWLEHDEDNLLCKAYICSVEDCPVLAYKNRGGWSAHVKCDKEADHQELRPKRGG